MKVVSVKKVESVPVFDITVEPGNNYILSNGIISHNSGTIYAASSIVSMTKRKVKDGTDLTGNIVTCTLDKGRSTKEGSKAEILIDFKTGLSRYHGLVDIAINAGIWEKTGNRVVVNGTKLYPKAIYSSPEKYFTADVLDSIDVYVNKVYTYGGDTDEE